MAEQKFEDAIKKLEAIVDELESGELSLDDAIGRYEEGMKLSVFCNKKLQEIQKKVEVLLKDATGKLSVKEFNASALGEEDAPKEQAQKQKASAKKKRPRGEELLF